METLKFLSFFILLACIISSCFAGPLEGRESTKADPISEQAALELLAKYDVDYSRECNKEMVARWAYITNVTTENEQAATNATLDYLAFQAKVQLEILTNVTGWENLENGTLRRAFQYLAIRGPGAMSPENLSEMKNLQAKMETAYATAKVPEFGCKEADPANCRQLSLEPDLEDVLRTATDFEELEYYWTAWHDAMATAVSTSDYKRFIELQNEQANATGYKDMGELWAAPYDDGLQGFNATSFEAKMLEIWEKLRPNYMKLHAYVRMKLRQNPLYVNQVKKFGYIPANLLGNMWAQDWTSLEAATKPFPDAPSVDATEAMIKAGYTPKIMFEKADEFFKGLGLLPMSDTFWAKSMIEKPVDREVVCHASAEDFCTGKGNEDFRIKMCTNVNQEDLVTVHHEMGHIEYFNQYTNQHYIYRDGANPGFHEAIGDALALAVTTPAHLECALGLDLGLGTECGAESRNSPRAVTETDINFLYLIALQKFSFFPFAISMDSWRWGVFNGSIPESEYNSKWWEIRQRNQGVAPPTSRTNSVGLDAAAKYHIVGNVEYIRYFISHILQFQFYEALCKAAGQFDPTDANSKPLYQCDFADSKEAGELFANMMQLGFSEPWPVALEAIAETSDYDIAPLMNYFEPLFEHIDKELEENGEIVGFGEDEARDYVFNYYEEEASRICNLVSVTAFEYESNLTSAEKEKAYNDALIMSANFDSSEFANNISQFAYQEFSDESLKRQLKFLNAIGTSALPEADLMTLNEVMANMSKIYGTAKICPYEKQDCNLETEGWNLEPEMTEKLAELKDYDELAYIWKAWRDASGKLMRDQFLKYVQLSNQAAELNGYANMGDFWLLRYESDTFRDDMEKVWLQVKDELYQPLYDYVRFKLSQKFSEFDPEGPIPAHLLGNMWSQTWENVLPYVLPYPSEPFFDITETLKEQTSKIEDEREKRVYMFDFANEFFKNLGLSEVKSAYGDKAMIVKPDDGREVICHASAWDMCDKQDFRIKMCTEINHLDFITIHHELGHVQYYMQYVDQPITYREGANPGFHEAIGDVAALSISTPQHLQGLNLLPADLQITDSSMLNYLMQMALDKIAFLPFGYLIDSYRWKVFSGEIQPDELERKWVEMRANYQGVVPPFKRNESDFDPAAKYHVAADVPYIRYFVSYILQFQIHEQLCKAAGHPANRPLYTCDISNNTAAGKLFGDILKAGGSKNWQDLLEDVTGERNLNANAIINYFKPLIEFMKTERENQGFATGFNVGDIEDYIGDSGEPLPTQPPSMTGSPPTESPQEEDEGNNTAAIVVGIILGIVVLVIVVGYFAGKRFRKN